MAICARCCWQVPDLINGLCEFCCDEKVRSTHFHECLDCNEVWKCNGHDCTGSSEYRCADCFMQLKLIELDE